MGGNSSYSSAAPTVLPLGYPRPLRQGLELLPFYLFPLCLTLQATPFANSTELSGQTLLGKKLAKFTETLETESESSLSKAACSSQRETAPTRASTFLLLGSEGG